MALAFTLAVGSALASEFLVSSTAYSKKSDVPGQEANCVERDTCPGGSSNCNITFDPGSGTITVPGYDGSTQTTLSCGNRLKMN